MVSVTDLSRRRPSYEVIFADPQIIRDEALNILLAGRDTVRLYIPWEETSQTYFHRRRLLL